MEEMVVCQSCSMPLVGDEHKGTEADGTHNDEYCMYCYANGNFTNDATLEEMIEDSANWAEMAGMTKEDMVKHAKEVLPQLKRWKKD